MTINAFERVAYLLVKTISATFIRIKVIDIFVVNYVCKKITKINCVDDSEVIVLILDKNRFREDLDALKNVNDWILLEVPRGIQDKINAISQYRMDNLINNIYAEIYSDNFIDNEDKSLIKGGYPDDNGLIYLSRILPKIIDKLKISCVLSCGMYYVRHFNWERVFNGTLTPFFCIHRESVGIDEHISRKMNEKVLLGKRKYFGDFLFVGVHHLKKQLVEMGYIEENRIRVTGVPRADLLVDRKINNKIKIKKKQVTLFSFWHTYLLDDLEIEKKTKWFDRENKDGFHDLFISVHSAIAKYALDHKDVNIVIKLKWNTGEFKKRVIDAIRESIGEKFDDLDNINITDKISAQELISQSDVLIGFNSTVISETMAMKKPIIIPVFDEAIGKYSENVAWRKRLDKLVVANSKEDLLKKIDEYLNPILFGTNINYDESLLKEAFGYIDGCNSKRLFNYIVALINRDLCINQPKLYQSSKIKTI